MATKLNVSIRKLLALCEEKVEDRTNYWRLSKEVKLLDTMVGELQELEKNDGTVEEKLPEYVKRLDMIKDKINYTPAQSLGLRPKHAPTAKEMLKEIAQPQAFNEYTNLRQQLLNDDNLRKRKTTEALNPESANEAIRYYNHAQEKITEHMLSLTRNLKEQTVTANRIIKKDTETVSRSTGLADRNTDSLQREAEKLEDHSRNAWKWWMWMMIIFVIGVFVFMVLFMKVMKKKAE